VREGNVRTIGLVIAISVLLFNAGCGGNGGGSSSNNNNNSASTKAQGVYYGTTSLGATFESIVLPNDKLYALYGITSGNTFLVYGLITGQGTSNNGSYTASLTDYYYTGTTFAGSLTAAYMVGSSLNGSYSESGQSETFTGSASPYLTSTLQHYYLTLLAHGLALSWMENWQRRR
jgi:hypothetical protein